MEIKLFAQSHGPEFPNRVCGLFSCLLGLWPPVQRPVLTQYCTDPDLALLTGLPGLTSEAFCQYGFVWWSQSCWPTLVTISRPALCALLGCCGAARLLGGDAAQPACLSPIAPGSLFLAEQQPLTTLGRTS